jgi:hypothetical protein
MLRKSKNNLKRKERQKQMKTWNRGNKLKLSNRKPQKMKLCFLMSQKFKSLKLKFQKFLSSKKKMIKLWRKQTLMRNRNSTLRTKR